MKISFTKSRARYILAAITVLVAILAFVFRHLFSFTYHKPVIIVSIAFLGLAVIFFLLLTDITLSKKINCIFQWFGIFIIPLLALMCVEVMQKDFFRISWKGALINYLIYFAVFMLLTLITRKFKIAVFIGMPLFCLIGAINHYVLAFRGSPMQPWDIAAVKTAMNVVGNFIFTVDETVLFSVLLTVIFILCACILQPFGFRKKGRIIFTAVFLPVCIVIGVVSGVLIAGNRGKFDRNDWNQTESSQKNGYIVNFLVNLQLMSNKAPEGYSTDKVTEILSEYSSDSKTDNMPNIIVIMNEAFADLTELDNIGLEEDYIPFTHSLQVADNTVTGDMVVSIFGGGTCNTEYEFLTSNICPMLRTGSFPMQQFVNSQSVSIASNLKEIGYHTIGIHPYYGSGWNRNRAYPFLGFDEFLTIDDFDDSASLIRNYISDEACYQKITHLTESADEQPTFIFAVTMQNHGGYEIASSDVPDTIKFTNQDQYPQTKQYLELAKLSDKALKELIEFYQKQDRDTVIVMFGDHQPSLGNEYQKLFPSTETKNNAIKKFEVPFVIWANFNIQSERIDKISPNYLAPLVLEKAKMPQTAFDKYLNDLRKEIPVFSKISCVDASGKAFDLTESSVEYETIINDYKILQYNNVFDKKELVAEKFCYQ